MFNVYSFVSSFIENQVWHRRLGDYSEVRGAFDTFLLENQDQGDHTVIYRIHVRNDVPSVLYVFICIHVLGKFTSATRLILLCFNLLMVA